ncbi:MAG: hypothetical protein BAA04_03670 [Firmicutes bacterium ZCTH02-B6]|nr:MAG: hypothetical protein BAA04_03670 [Firmicutes bacterium ZCTH02-B6]
MSGARVGPGDPADAPDKPDQNSAADQQRHVIRQQPPRRDDDADLVFGHVVEEARRHAQLQASAGARRRDDGAQKVDGDLHGDHVPVGWVGAEAFGESGDGGEKEDEVQLVGSGSRQNPAAPAAHHLAEPVAQFHHCGVDRRRSRLGSLRLAEEAQHA